MAELNSSGFSTGHSESVAAKEQESEVRYAVATDVGKKRTENQDSYGVIKNSTHQLFIVADGMGGAKGGAIASSLAISTLEKVFNENKDKLLSPKLLVAAVEKANAEIYTKGTTESHLDGMGTTFVALGLIKDKLLVANVGDSRAYRIRNLEITQLTTDHTLVQELVRSGSITQDQAEDHPVSHMLTRSLGPSPEVQVDCDYDTGGAYPGDKYLICSDGLYNMVPLSIILDIVNNNTLDDAIQKLINYANEQGGNDNITAILIEVRLSAKKASDAGTAADVGDQDNGADNLPYLKKEEVPYFNTNPLRNKGVPAAATEVKKKLAIDSRIIFFGLVVAFLTGTFFNPWIVRKVVSPELENSSQPSEGYGNKNTIAKKQNKNEATNNFSNQQQANQSGNAGSNEENEAGYSPYHQVVNVSIKPEAAQLEGREFPTAEVYEPAMILPPSQVGTGSAGVEVSNPSKTGSGSKSERSLDELLEVTNTRDIKLRQVQEIDRRIKMLDQPISSEITQIGDNSKRQIAEIDEKLIAVNQALDSATRRLTVWYGRAKDIEKSDPLALLNEVALTSDTVNNLKSVFEKATWEYLKISEALKINPKDPSANENFKEVSKTRNEITKKLSQAIKDAAQLEIDKAEQEISNTTVSKGELEKDKEKAMQEALFSKAILSSDSNLKKEVKEKLTHQKDIIMIELGLQ